MRRAARFGALLIGTRAGRAGPRVGNSARGPEGKMKHAIVASALASVWPMLVSVGGASSLNTVPNQLGAFHAVGALDASQLQAIHTSK